MYFSDAVLIKRALKNDVGASTKKKSCVAPSTLKVECIKFKKSHFEIVCNHQGGEGKSSMPKSLNVKQR